MAYYKTQIDSVRAGYAVDVSGKRLKFIGNYPCQAGDFVWTDGNVIFGNITNDSQPILFGDKSGIPILADNLRGYYNSVGKFKNFKIAEQGLSDEDLSNKWWFINSNNKIFYDVFFSEYEQPPYEDIEISADNNVFAISRFLGDSDYFEVRDIYGDLNYSRIKEFDDFKSSGDDISLLFLKLQKGDKYKKDKVKWVAVFKTSRSTHSTVRLPEIKRITLVQHSEIEQTLSYTQPEIRTCTVEAVEDDSDSYVGWNTGHEEIFIVDSDGNKKIIYECDSSGVDSSVGELTTDKVVVDHEGTTVLPTYPSIGFQVTNFEGTATTRWTGIGVAEVECVGKWYKVIKEPVPADVGGGSTDETFDSFTYPVQDGFYIAADDINSTLKLYDANDNLVLDFATSGDNFLAGLTGFHNFAAIVVKNNIKADEREYLLGIHQLPPLVKPSYLWRIKKGKATKLSEHCYNYRFCKMRDISKARR